MLTAIIIVTFVLFLVLGLPIAFVLAVSSISAALFLGLPLYIICQRFFTAIDSFPLMAIPLFMLAGTFMSKGGITEAIIGFGIQNVFNIEYLTNSLTLANFWIYDYVISLQFMVLYALFLVILTGIIAYLVSKNKERVVLNAEKTI